MPKPSRAQALMVAALVTLGVGFALVPVGAQQIHRHGFGGKDTVLVRGDANVRVEVKEHNISDQAFKSQPTSEHIKFTSEVATGDSAFIHYHYDTPQAPVSPALSAGVWVKATKAGVQLRARVVFPKEPDPTRPESPLTMLVIGDTYEKSRSWQKLTFTDVPALIGKHLPVLQTKIGRAVNTGGAYIDRLVLNLYTGPGEVDVWIDDLDIGPVKPPAETKPPAPGVPVKQTKPGNGSRGRVALQQGGQLFVDNKPFFFRAVRHTGAPLHVLRQAGFDALWVPADVSTEVLEEANREGWLIVPSAPIASSPINAAVGSAALQRDADALATYYRKFSGTDVLFWDLGGGRTDEQYPAVDRTKNLLRDLDPQRPVGADVWDGFQAYSSSLDLVGAHRWPLFTSLELERYRDWLVQRTALTSGHAVFWTWIQNHLPDWYLTSVLGKKGAEKFDDPIGPHPEQVRVLAYIGVACGCRGLGFWSDRFLADTHHGRDRLQGMAILNSELEMLAPVLLAPQRERPQWLDTNNPNVKAALLRGSRGAVLLPIWLGRGGQYVPEQGAVASLTITVPLVADGADPWRITPAGVECLRNDARKVTGGTELTIREFDLVTPIVFTSELNQNGIVVWWQDYARKYGRIAARWALDLAAEEYEKVFAIHAKLLEMGVTVRGADRLFEQAARFHDDARRNFAAELYDKAFADAHRALRPLRVIARDHWYQATATLDTPTASPFAVSYFSLPKHWELFRAVQASQLVENVLSGGTFEPTGGVPETGLEVSAIPGWSARFGTLDRVNVAAGIVPSAKLVDKIEPKKDPPPLKMFGPSRPIPTGDEGYVPPAPELGRGVLKLEVRRRGQVGRDGKPIAQTTHPLERTFLTVDSPPVRLPPGSLVRVSGWVKVPGEIQGTADGALFYDDAGGEPLAVRLLTTGGKWKKFHLYRKVPATGQISLTVALTGVGVAYFDELRIEPLVAPAPAAPQNAGYAPYPGSVQPAGGVRKK
ncbi:MAG: hypothetical protein L0241_05790 [Planctomycetia bacterium]|nr:hypothetical protein [Planctomycetia bacterium]